MNKSDLRLFASQSISVGSVKKDGKNLVNEWIRELSEKWNGITVIKQWRKQTNNCWHSQKELYVSHEVMIMRLRILIDPIRIVLLKKYCESSMKIFSCFMN